VAERVRVLDELDHWIAGRRERWGFSAASYQNPKPGRYDIVREEKQREANERIVALDQLLATHPDPLAEILEQALVSLRMQPGRGARAALALRHALGRFICADAAIEEIERL
jgi:hypothetical protein